MAAARGASLGRRAEEGKQHCSFCKNHDKEEKKIGHICVHKDCSCLLCKLTVKGQVAMKYQQKVWRHQKREGMDKHCKMIGVSTRQLCDKCRNHYEFSKKQGHKAKCKFEKCVCPYCNLTDKRRLVMKLIQRVRRANVISRAISSDEDEDDVDASSPHSDDMSSGSLDGQQENISEGSLTKCAIVGVIEQVTQAIEALPIDLSAKSAAFLKPAKNSSVRAEATLGTEFSPLRESPPPDGLVPFGRCMPTNSVQSAVSTNCTKHVALGPTPRGSDIVTPPETCYVKKTSQISPPPDPDNKSAIFEAPVAIKKEKAEGDTAWAETTSFEQKYTNHSHFFSSPPYSSYVARPAYSSYPSNMASSCPLWLKQEESCVISPSAVSSTINRMCKSVCSPCCEWPQTDYMTPNTFDSSKVNDVDVMRDNFPHYENNIPGAGRMQHMLSFREISHPKNHYTGCYVSSALPYPTRREYVYDRPRIPDGQFAEHHAMRPKQRYSNHLAPIKHSPINSLPKVSSKTAIDATSALQYPILASHLRSPRPAGVVPYQNYSQADDFLQRSPIFLRYPGQNY